MLMQPYDIRSAIFQYWQDNYTTTPTMYPNTEFPDSFKQSPFISLEIDFLKSQTRIASKQKSNRHRGYLTISINAPRDSGNKTSYELAQEIIELFSGERVGGSIAFDSAWIDKEEYREEHFTLVVLAPFRATIS